MLRYVLWRRYSPYYLSAFVIPFKKWPNSPGESAFSIIELVAVLAVMMALLTVGVSLTHGTGSQSRRVATDLVAGMVEQARTVAIASRSCVILAIAAPGDLAASDGCCRLGLFKAETWPENPEEPIKCTQMGRWRMLEPGIALIDGGVDGVENPLDGPEIGISYGNEKSLTASVHAIAFNTRGGLHHPAGSSPIVIRIAEGNYRGGNAIPYQHGVDHMICENRLKIGRVIARSNRMN